MEAREDYTSRYRRRSAIFKKQSDFNKVLLTPGAKGSSILLIPKNPHPESSVNWSLFEEFREHCTFYTVGSWPKRNEFLKSDINFQFFLYGRRVQMYDPLRDDYTTEVILDVEEAAVYVGK